MRPTFVEIDLNAIAHNFKVVKQQAPHAKIMAVIKANAYGHGLEAVAKVLNKADALGVAFLDEAICLREAGVTQPIVLLEGFFNAKELSDISHYGLETVIHDFAQLKILESNPPAQPIRVWLKINTGLCRLGFSEEETRKVVTDMMQSPHIQKPLHFLSHFSEPDHLESTVTVQQMTCFDRVTNGFDGERSLANSAAIFKWPASQMEWVRPGIMLYGISPFAYQTGETLGLKPAMTLHSELMVIHRLKKGDRVGYGGTWVCPEAMSVGVIPIGYADGYPRHAPNNTPVCINGKMVPLIGRVSMDMITVDLRTQPDTKVGDPVVLWGAGLPIEKIAQQAETIGYELVCQIAHRVRRVYKP